MYRNIPSKDIVLVEKVKMPFLCSLFGHKPTISSTVDAFGILYLEEKTPYTKIIGFKTVCKRCGNLFIQATRLESFYKYKTENLYLFYFFNNGNAKIVVENIERFSSYDEIESFIVNNKLTKKRKWWQNYDWQFLILSKSREKIAVCSKTLELRRR